MQQEIWGKSGADLCKSNLSFKHSGGDQRNHHGVWALTTFVISDLLGGGKILLIGNVIEQSFKQNSNWHVGSGLSLVLMVFIIASMALVAKYDKGEGGTVF